MLLLILHLLLQFIREQLPQIVNQSSPDTNICAGSTVDLFVNATGTGLTYQWYNDNGLLSGNTSNNFITGIAGNYYCIVQDACTPADTSSVFTVSLLSLPQIINQSSKDTMICSGSAATLFVSATGSGLMYQWYNDSGIMSGKTNDTLTINNQQSTINYYCIVSGTCSPSATSSTITITTGASPQITNQSLQNINICSGSTAAFICYGNRNDLTYQWYNYANGSWNLINRRYK